MITQFDSLYTGHVDIAYTDQRGDLLAENRETLVYRLATSDPSGAGG